MGSRIPPRIPSASVPPRPLPRRPIAAFTASATRKVRHDILTQLKLREPKTFITSFARRNLRYYVRDLQPQDKEKLLPGPSGTTKGESIIVYGPTVNMVEETAALLNDRGIPALQYHGKMDNGRPPVAIRTAG